VTHLDFELTVEREEGGALRVVVRGELDIATAPRLEAVLADSSASSLRVDLRGLTFMDSTGVRTLLQATEDARAAGRELRFRMPADGDAHVVLLETGIARLLPQDVNGA
jgi:anti-anti-sigma factor